jgi:hypothetical protein
MCSFNPETQNHTERLMADANAALDRLTQAYDVLKLDREQFREDRQRLCDSAARLAIACDAQEQRFIVKQRADEEAKEQQIQADKIKKALDALNGQAEIHHPAGDLHSVEPSEPQHKAQLHPDAGGVPLSYGAVPLSYERRKAESEGDLPNELTKEVPVDPGTEPELSGSREPEAKNPVGISW